LKRIQNIQALRGVAVISVVFFHIFSLELKYGGINTILPSFFQFGMFGVDLFFVISGFVIYSISRGKFKSPANSLRFIYHRIARIYPVYWIYTLLVLSVFIIKPSLVNSYQGNQIDLISSFLLLPSQTLPLVIVGWTLVHEMYFYIIFCLIIFFIDEKKLLGVLFVWIAVVVSINLLLESNNPWIKVISHPMTLEFIAGCLLGLLFFNIDLGLSRKKLIYITIISFLISLTAYMIFRNLTNSIEPAAWWRTLIFGIPAVLIIFSMIYAEKCNFYLSSFLISIGNASYSIYLTHVLTLSAFGHFWSMFAADGIIDNIIMIPVSFALVLLTGFISYTYLEKPLLNLSKKIL